MLPKIQKTADMNGVLSALIRENPKDATVLVCLFGGDRWSCCDEAAVVTDADGGVVAIATIAPEGEMGQGEPTIVGLYVLRAVRRQSLGESVFVTAVERCLERGFKKVRVDVLSKTALRLIGRVPKRLRAALVVSDQSGVSDIFDA